MTVDCFLGLIIFLSFIIAIKFIFFILKDFKDYLKYLCKKVIIYCLKKVSYIFCYKIKKNTYRGVSKSHKRNKYSSKLINMLYKFFYNSTIYKGDKVYSCPFLFCNTLFFVAFLILILFNYYDFVSQIILYFYICVVSSIIFCIGMNYHYKVKNSDIDTLNKIYNKYFYYFKMSFFIITILSIFVGICAFFKFPFDYYHLNILKNVLNDVYILKNIFDLLNTGNKLIFIIIIYIASFIFKFAMYITLKLFYYLFKYGNKGYNVFNKIDEYVDVFIINIKNRIKEIKESIEADKYRENLLTEEKIGE